MTKINYIGGETCTTSDCGAGGTLEQFDQTLKSYSVVPTDYPSSNRLAWNVTKSFFTGFSPKAVYRSFVDPNGCDRLLARAFAEDFNPLPGDGPDAGEVAELAPKVAGAAGLARASLYSASKGLTVPLRSSIYRGLRAGALSDSVAVEELAFPVLTVYATGDALWTAGSAAHNRECH